MSLFSKVLTKLGLRRPEGGEKAGGSTKAKPARSPGQSRKGAEFKRGAGKGSDEIPVIDVVSQLEERAAKNPQELNWKVSIVDLLKLLDLDSSYEARKEMAIELGCPEDKLDDSAEMNTWLHQTVLRRIAENGGNIPQDLLD